jgi:outer membrane lipoprotein carrier protein
MTRRSFTFALVLSLAAGSAAVAPANAGPNPAPAKKPAGAPLTGDEIADRVQGFYDNTKTFRAGFKQRYTVKAHNKTLDSQGQVIFEKPGRMSWRYTNNGNRVVSDGKLIKIYEKENKQMYEQPLEKSQYPAALAFLVGGGSLKQSFKLTRLDSKQMGFEAGYVLVGEPKDATPSYEKIFLYIDPQTYQVRRVLLLDAQSNRNRFDFVAPEVNKKLPANEFVFAPPPGTQIIRP